MTPPRLLSLAVIALTACSDGRPGALSSIAAPATPESFAGNWQSTTPSYEFINLAIVSKSSTQHALGARLMLSGSYWDGSARVDGDSLIATMNYATTTQPAGVVTARLMDSTTMRARMQATGATPIELTFRRQD